MQKIVEVAALEILDGRGDPTVQVTVTANGGARGTALVPSGRSTGRHEAKEVRDEDPARYAGRGVRAHIGRVLPEICEALVGYELNLPRVDEMLIQLDGTPDKSRLGANVTAGVSLAAAKAAAHSVGEPLFRFLNPYARALPVPQMNLINGGRHAFNETAVQEFIILPLGAQDFATALEWTMRVYHTLSEIVAARYGRHALNTGDEGGLTPDIRDLATGLDLLREAAAAAGRSEGIRYGLDMAATHLYRGDSGQYLIDRAYTPAQLFDLYEAVVREKQVVSIEDPVEEDDFAGLAELTQRLSCQLVGDDLFVTNPKRVHQAIAMRAGNALLWKFNQIGTLSEAWDAARLAQSHGYDIVVSERSGDTEDPAIADLAVALGASQIKTGSPVRGERTAKYNRLLNIAQELGETANYFGASLLERYA